MTLSRVLMLAEGRYARSTRVTGILAAVLVAVVLTTGTALAQMNPGPDETIDAARQSVIIDSVTTALDSNYVFPEKAMQMKKFVRDQYKKGAYKAISSAVEFSQQLTKDLRSICHDRHLAIGYFQELPNQMKDTDSMTQADQDEMVRELKRDNFGFYKLEHLEGNIGYLDLRGFQEARFAGATAVAAMNFLSNSDALIIDLRQNGGGSPSMIQLLSSYLFEDSKLLNSFYIRPKDTIEQFWTQAYVTGPKMPSVPVYILTSHYTFSAAEEFTYNLKNMKRATIVGDTTGGGAHPVMYVYYPTIKFDVKVPMGRAINPITGTNWEGVGVIPDIAVPSDQALTVAHLEALKKIRDEAKDEQRKGQLSWLIETMEALTKPATVDEAVLQKYAGKYGPRVIILDSNALYYQREGRPKYRMTPMSKDTFVFDDLPYFRIKFISDNAGTVTKLVGIYDDGHTDDSPRTSD